MYKNIKSLSFTPEANIILYYINFNSVKIIKVTEKEIYIYIYSSAKIIKLC